MFIKNIGDSNGTIAIWSRGSNSIYKTIRNAHKGPVFSLLALREGGILSGGLLFLCCRILKLKCNLKHISCK